MTKRTRWGDRDGRRRDILASGHSLLAERGYAALQMRDVAAGAGISLGTVYLYFATKEDLYAAMFGEGLSGLRNSLRSIADDPGDPETMFVDVATRYRDIYAVYGRELNLWSLTSGDSAVRDNPELLATAQECFGLLVRIVHSIRGSEVPEDVDDATVLTIFWATVIGLCDQYTGLRSAVHDLDWESTVRVSARIVLGGLSSLAGADSADIVSDDARPEQRDDHPGGD